MPSNNFEEKLRQRFEGAKMPPSPDVWPQLADKLEEKKRRGRIFPFWGSGFGSTALPHVIGIAAAGVALLFLFWLNGDTDPTVQTTPGITKAEIEATNSSPAAPAVVLEANPAPDSHEAISSPPEHSYPNQVAAATENHTSPPTTEKASSGAIIKAPIVKQFESFEENSPLSAQTNPLLSFASQTADKPIENISPGPVLHNGNLVKEIDLTPLSLAINEGSHTFHTVATAQELVAHIEGPFGSAPLIGRLVSVNVIHRKGRFGLGIFGGRNHQTKNHSVGITQQGLVNNGVSYTGGGTNNQQSGISPTALDVSGEKVGQVNYPTISTGAGVQLEYFLGRNLSVQTGVGVNRHIQERSDGGENRDALVANGSPTQEPFNNSNEIRYTDITIPAFINYYLRKGKSALMLSGGLAYQRIVDKDGVVQVENPQNLRAVSSISDALNAELLPVNSFQFAGRAHFQYNFSRRFAIHAGPNVGMGLNSAYKTEYLSQSRPLALGWEVGVKFFPGS